jgi:hypothetical protein
MAGGVEHVLYAFYAAHVGYLMQVGNDAESSVRYDGTGILGDIEQRAFDVRMAVYESRNKVLPFYVKRLTGKAVVPDTGYQTAVDGYASCFNLAVENVDDAGIG